jgi:hypothetical protein
LRERRLLFIDIQLTNIGRGWIQAKTVGTGTHADKDEFEIVKYSGSLQIKQIRAESIKGDESLDWFTSPVVQAVPGIDEINLLDEYVRTDRNNEIYFWLEPGESVHLGATVVLSPGHYLLKVTFYGPKFDEFWHRLKYVYLE